MNPRVAKSASEPSDWALRDLAARVAKFLYAIATNVSLRGEMQSAGYTPADHAEGLALLQVACEYRDNGYDRAEDAAAKAAEAELVTWASANVGRYRAAVERLCPEHLTLFAQLEWRTPAEAVLAVDKLLRRLSDLPWRPPSMVRRLLERRGLTATERTRLQALVDAAKGANVPGGGDLDALERTEAGATSPEVLALYNWYADWVATARAVVRRKDWLGSMGVVRRGG